MINAQPKPVRELDEPYLDYIRSLPCVGMYLMSIEDRVRHSKVCVFLSSGRSEANHIRAALFTGLGTKPSDKGFTLPFCSVLHELYTLSGHNYFMAAWDITDQTLFKEMRRLEREYNRAHPKVREKRPRVKTDRLLLQHGNCGLHPVKGGRAWCPRQRKYLEAR